MIHLGSACQGSGSQSWLALSIHGFPTFPGFDFLCVPVWICEGRCVYVCVCRCLLRVFEISPLLCTFGGCTISRGVLLAWNNLFLRNFLPQKFKLQGYCQIGGSHVLRNEKTWDGLHLGISPSSYSSRSRMVFLFALLQGDRRAGHLSSFLL